MDDYDNVKFKNDKTRCLCLVMIIVKFKNDKTTCVCLSRCKMGSVEPYPLTISYYSIGNSLFTFKGVFIMDEKEQEVTIEGTSKMNHTQFLESVGTSTDTPPPSDESITQEDIDTIYSHWGEDLINKCLKEYERLRAKTSGNWQVSNSLQRNYSNLIKNTVKIVQMEKLSSYDTSGEVSFESQSLLKVDIGKVHRFKLMAKKQQRLKDME